MNAAILTIGDELMIGQVTDTNRVWIAQQLDLAGHRVVVQMSCGDDIDTISNSIQYLFDNADLLVLSGGLGPTEDDKTVDSICKALNCEKTWHEETWQRLLERFKNYKRPASDLHKKQCYLPEIANIISNDQGTAPGIFIHQSEKYLLSVPGVPIEMRHLLGEKMLPLIPHDSAIQHRFIFTVGEGETFLAEQIADIENQLPPFIRLAYLPDFGAVALRLTLIGDNVEKLEDVYEQIKTRLLPYTYSYSHKALSIAIGKLLLERNEMVSIAESCTGGFLSHAFTKHAGSSSYFKGAVVPYDNDIKNRLLHVPQTTLDAHGAVSEEVVIRLAEEVRREMKTAWSLSISGIAGPTGGSDDKPVGLVWIACSGPNGTKTKKFNFKRDRMGNIESTAQVALYMLWQELGTRN